MTIVKCQAHKGQIQGSMAAWIITNASKQRSDIVLNNTGQYKLLQKRTTIEDTNLLTNQRPDLVARA
jgi:hypothetical protein